MKILLTGFAGNLGKAVAPHLIEQGHDLRVLLHGAVLDPKELSPNLEIIWGSLSHPDLFDQLVEDVDAVVHCAWDGRGANDGSMVRVNMEGSLGLLEAAERHGVKTFIYISSVATYGLNQSLWGKVLDEDQAFVSEADSLNAYPWAKVLIENELAKAKDNLRMNLAIVRPGLLFSAEKAPAKKLIKKGQKAYGMLVGSAKNHLPYIHVDDVAEMISMLLAAPPKYAVYNAVPTSYTPARDFLKRWGAQAGYRVKVIKMPKVVLRMMSWAVGRLKKAMGREGGGGVDYQIMTGVRDIRYSAQKAVKELGWQDRKTTAIAQYAGH